MSLTRVPAHMISFTPEGVGAVARKVSEKLSESVSVKDFGAVGDGVTDDTAAVQATFDAANAAIPRKAVFFPCGQYKITSTVNARDLPYYGQDRQLSKILCNVPNGNLTIANSGQVVENLYFYGPGGGAQPDGIGIGGNKNYVVKCFFEQLNSSICPTSIIVTSVVTQCEFLACDSAINDKLHDGTSAHTTLFFTDNNVLYGGKAFQLNTDAAGFYVAGNVFEDLSYVYASNGKQIFASVFESNWVEQMARNCTIFFQTFAGGTNVSIMNSLRPGAFVITDAIRWNSGKAAVIGEIAGGGGGVAIDSAGIRVADFNGFGIRITPQGIERAAELTSFGPPADVLMQTQVANVNFGSRGGDYVFDTGLGSLGGRKGAVRTLADNDTQLGDAAYRWSVVYAATPAINTSDANEKEQIEDLSDAEKAVALAIKSKIKKFKFKDAVALKGDGARIHVGAIAQEVEQAFADGGLDASQYGIFCRDVWYTVFEEEKGEEVHVYKDADGNYPAGAKRYERLGLRYEELLAFVIAAI